MRRLVLYSVLALGIGAFFLYLAARELPFAEVASYAKTADHAHILLYSLLFIALYAICHGTRVIRWYQLVAPLEEDLPAGLVHRVCLVGMTAIMVLPLRLGEFVRPALLARKSSVSMSAALGTAVVERVVDGLIVTGLLFVTLAAYSGDADVRTVRGLGFVSAAVFVPALGVSLLAYWRREWTVGWVRRILSLGSDAVGAKLSGMLDSFILGFQSLARANNLGKFLVLSVLYWGSNAFSMWILAAYGFGLDVGMWEILTVLAVLVVGIMIPAGPGMAGNFEYFLLVGLSMFLSVEDADVAGRIGAFGATLHVLQFLVIGVPGIVLVGADPEARVLVQRTALESE